LTILRSSSEELEILYLDASGDPGMYNHTNSEHYILGGLAIGEANWTPITHAFNTILLKYYPKGNPPEIHTKDLFVGKAPYNNIDHEGLVKDQ
jgi:hypothetical protein